MLQIQNALGILSSQVPTGNLLWVDQINGVDKLATRGRLTIPFKTLTAAKNAAKSGDASNPGDTIMVLPGKYNEKNLLKHYVNWYFFPGAIVHYIDTDPGGIFDTSNYGSNGSVTCAIRGYGDFKVANSLESGYVVNSSASGSTLEIDGVSMSGGSAACIRAAGASGSLRIKVSGLLTGSGDVVAIAGASDQNLIEADELSTSGGDVVRVTAGGVHLKARRMATSSGTAISFSGSGAGQSVFEAYEILSQSNWAVHYNASSAIVTIIGARIVSQFADEAGFALYIESSVSDVVKLANCVLIVTPTLPPGSIGASSPSTRVHLLNGVAANKDKTSDITVLGTALTVSADFT